jgi:2-polyprenyl-6-methoxyphenol hydroxylase-like FAD-dependent oxidoreductase
VLQGSASQQIPDLDVAWGKRVVEISGISPRLLQQGLVSDPLVVKFSDGSYEEGDLVVGADGAHSVVRRLMFPHSNLMYTGKTCISAILDVEATEDPFEVYCRCCCCSAAATTAAAARMRSCCCCTKTNQHQTGRHTCPPSC